MNRAAESATRLLLCPLALLVSGTLAPAGARMGPKPRTCPAARYRVTGAPLASDATGTGSILELGGAIAIDGACAPVAPKRFAGRRTGATVVAATWKACSGLRGRVRLHGKLLDGCRRFHGTLVVGRRGRRIDARLSECADGFVEVGGGKPCAGREAGDACALSCVPAAGSTTFVGEVDGASALIALVRDDQGLTAYTCGLGANVTTHTGWFFGAPASKGARDPDAIPALTSADGLVLAGRVDGDTASGTVTLPDGRELPWKAVPTRPGSGAGLYQSEDALALTGLIVDDEGRMAGNARLRIPALEGSGPAAGSVPVTVPGGVPPGGSPTVVVTFPVGTAVRTLPLAPVLSGGTKTISVPSPTVIFLVHGMSDAITTPADAAEDPVKCEGPRNTPFYSRCEWGIDFIPGLFGLTANRPGSLFNLAGQDVSGMRYLTDPANRPFIDETLGITARDARGCVSDPGAVETYDPRAAFHFVTASRPDPHRAPSLSVFVTWRDSTRGVVESARRVTNQAYAALRWYETQYRQAPKVIFLVQSFGGLATRFLLSNPPPAVFDTALLNADRIPICDEERAKMDYLRNRTLFAVTLATPHEGSFMAEWGQPPKDFIRSAIADLQGTLAGTNALARLVRSLDAGLSSVVGHPVGLIARARVELARLDRLLDSPALRDLRLATMRAFNRGPLSPERARRTAGSPIAGAQDALVPIYATLGRSPGGAAFDSPKLLEGFARYDSEREKEKGWIIGTMFFSDLLVKQFMPNGFGRVGVAPYAPFASILDRRARVFDLSSQNADAEQFVARAAEGVLGGLSAYFAGHFGPGVDGVLAYLSRARLQVTLPNAIVPIHVDREWVLTLSGSVDVPIPAFTCGGQTIPIDYDDLVRALFTTFGNTEDILTGLSGASPADVVAAVLAAAGEGGDLLTGVAGWLLEKAVQLGAPPAGCELPAHLLDWRLVRATGSVPAPEWTPTDTPVHDGEMDTDGPVHSASALGFTLGRRPFFFEHDRNDGPVVNGKPTPGSWYRLYDNPVTEQYNHGMQYENDVALWVFDDFLVANVGPLVRRDGFSVWP
jgi:hypothetical protein